MTKKSILVPHDFTQLGDFALEHAYMIGKATDVPINVLHVIKKQTMYDEAFEKLQKISIDFAEKHNITVNPIVMKGNLYKTIYECGIQNNAFLSVMGTHGIKTVKRAMKVVKKFMKIPFILVQNPVIFGEYNKIVIPIDANIKSRIKFQWVKFINLIFKCEVNIIHQEINDSYKKQILHNNIKFAENLLTNELIDYQIKKVNSSDKYVDEIYNHANEIKSNLILIMTDQYRKFVKDIKKSDNLEYFQKIPIMCINPRTDIYKLGGFS